MRVHHRLAERPWHGDTEAETCDIEIGQAPTHHPGDG